MERQLWADVWRKTLDEAARRLLADRPALLMMWHDPIGSTVEKASRYLLLPDDGVFLAAHLGNVEPLEAAADGYVRSWRQKRDERVSQRQTQEEPRSLTAPISIRAPNPLSSGAIADDVQPLAESVLAAIYYLPDARPFYTVADAVKVTSSALYPHDNSMDLTKNDLAREVSRLAHVAEFEAAASSGEVEVLNPTTKTRHTMPTGDALMRGLIARDELQLFAHRHLRIELRLRSSTVSNERVADEVRASGHYSLDEAASKPAEAVKQLRYCVPADRWLLVKPSRWDALTRALYGLLEKADKHVKPPSAHEVLVTWISGAPLDLTVREDSVEFSREKGTGATVSVRALQARIDRLVQLTGQRAVAREPR